MLGWDFFFLSFCESGIEGMEKRMKESWWEEPSHLSPGIKDDCG